MQSLLCASGILSRGSSHSESHHAVKSQDLQKLAGCIRA